MNREAGAYIEINGVIQPDLSDEAMAARQQLAPSVETTPKKKKAEAEVSDVKE